MMKKIKCLICNDFYFLSQIWNYCPSLFLWLILDIICSIIQMYLNIVYLTIILHIFGSDGQSMKKIFFVTLFFFIFKGIADFFDSYINSYVYPKSKEKLSKSINENLFDVIINTPYDIRKSKKFYDSMNIAFNQANVLPLEFLDTIKYLVINTICGFGFIWVLATVDKLVVFLIFLQVIIVLKTSFNNTNIFTAFYKKTVILNRQSDYVKRIFYLEDYFKELIIYPSLNKMLLNKYIQSVSNYIEEINKHFKKMLKNELIQRIINNIISFFEYIYIFIIVLKKGLGISELYLYLNSVGQLTIQIISLFKVIPNLYQYSLYSEMIQEFLKMKYNCDQKSDLIIDMINEINIKDVCFSYDEDHLVINHLNVKLIKGDKVLICGENGSGKTTLIKLLCRLYIPTYGLIELNGVDYREYAFRIIKNKINVIFQDYQVYSLTIAENILLREIKKDDDIAIVISALKQVNLYDKVINLDKGINAVVTREFDEEGIYLSGGECQRLILARMLVNHGDVLILDEFDSQIDKKNNTEIVDLIFTLFSENIIFFVSHKDEMINYATKKIEFKKNNEIEIIDLKK